MKKLLIAFAIVPALLLLSCATVSKPTIDAGISLAVTEALKYGIRDSAKRTALANLVDYVASFVRTLTGNPTPDQLSAAITGAIPANIRAQFPEILSLVIPLIVNNYGYLNSHFSAGSAVLNEIATDLEAGVAAYISAPKTTSP
jgi:hypothetical protein